MRGSAAVPLLLFACACAALFFWGPLPSARMGRSGVSPTYRSGPKTQGGNIATMAANPAYDADNIFAKIVDGKLPCFKIFETEHALAFMDAFPVAEGHSLLVPKAKGYADIMDMPEDVAANVLKELPRLARAVKAATGAPGVNIVQNNGAAAGQVVFHTHFHVIPRSEKDEVVMMAGPKDSKMLSQEAASPLLDKIKAAL
eukprot:TRINITY_DN4620_c0_g1_i2.p2 TRINITY_DN4620_c0_g1~~TRINITY_DN4620_c0_g1_i2.p2  ORF type:complete len:200 (+),score=70.04 TRINITY_DN4620_c0_g1_i2:296-895(+)